MSINKLGVVSINWSEELGPSSTYKQQVCTYCVRTFMSKVRWYIVLLVSAMLVNPSCRRDSAPGLFEWTLSVPVELPLNPNAFEGKVITIRNIPTLIRAQLTGRGLGEEDIAKIELRRSSLVTQFRDQKLNFIREVSLDVYKTDMSVHVEMAYKDPVDFSVDDQIDFFTSLPDITPFFLEDQINLQLAYRVRDINPTIHARLILDLKAIAR